MKNKRLYIPLAIIVLVLFAWLLFFHFVPPETLVRTIGVQNTYLFAFLLAVIAGFSSITGTSLYATIAALAHGGVNNLILGIVSGLGLFLSDSFFYFVAVYGRNFIAQTASHWERLFKWIHEWVHRAPRWLVFAVVFLYSAFAPIPNDILLGVLAISGYSYKQFFPYLLLGDITAMILLTMVSQSV